MMKRTKLAVLVCSVLLLVFLLSACGSPLGKGYQYAEAIPSGYSAPWAPEDTSVILLNGEVLDSSDNDYIISITMNQPNGLIYKTMYVTKKAGDTVEWDPHEFDTPVKSQDGKLTDWIENTAAVEVRIPKSQYDYGAFNDGEFYFVAYACTELAEVSADGEEWDCADRKWRVNYILLNPSEPGDGDGETPDDTPNDLPDPSEAGLDGSDSVAGAGAGGDTETDGTGTGTGTGTGIGTGTGTGTSFDENTDPATLSPGNIVDLHGVQCEFFEGEISAPCVSYDGNTDGLDLGDRADKQKCFYDGTKAYLCRKPIYADGTEGTWGWKEYNVQDSIANWAKTCGGFPGIWQGTKPNNCDALAYDGGWAHGHYDSVYRSYCVNGKWTYETLATSCMYNIENSASNLIATGGGLCFIDGDDGEVKCAGANPNFNQQIGEGSVPKIITYDGTNSLVQAGFAPVELFKGQAPCVRVTGGKILCWGLNYNPIPSTSSVENSFYVITSHPSESLGSGKFGEDIVDIISPPLHACALKQDGSVWCWGYNGDCRLGNDNALSGIKNEAGESLLLEGCTTTTNMEGSTCDYGHCRTLIPVQVLDIGGQDKTKFLKALPQKGAITGGVYHTCTILPETAASGSSSVSVVPEPFDDAVCPSGTTSDNCVSWPAGDASSSVSCVKLAPGAAKSGIACDASILDCYYQPETDDYYFCRDLNGRDQLTWVKTSGVNPSDCEDPETDGYPAKNFDSCDSITYKGDSAQEKVYCLNSAWTHESAVDATVIAGCAKTEEFSYGKVVCWGRNEAGVIGKGDFEGDGLAIPQIQGNYYYGVPGAGESGTILSSDVTSKAKAVNFPTYVVDKDGTHITGITKLASGSMTVCGLQEASGKIFCWGSDRLGVLGTNTWSADSELDTSRPYASAVVNSASNPTPATDFVDLDAGGDTFCAIKSDTSAVCWGEGTFGQLGNGLSGFHPGQTGYNRITEYRVSAPVQVVDFNTPLEAGGSNKIAAGSTPQPLKNIKSVSVADTGMLGHVCFELTDGKIACTGNNYESGQLGIGVYPYEDIPGYYVDFVQYRPIPTLVVEEK